MGIERERERERERKREGEGGETLQIYRENESCLRNVTSRLEGGSGPTSTQTGREREAARKGRTDE